jgi:DNA-binding winged helix-turn-helix (wHTH) protein/TolB-like protein
MRSFPMDPPRSRSLRFGEFEFDLGSEELRRGDARLRLQAQPSRLLALLISRAGDLVTREEIQERLWGDETFVDFGQGINHCIRQIRAALGDDAEAPRFIQTLPKRGYRFLPAVEPAGQRAATPGTSVGPSGRPCALRVVALGGMLTAGAALILPLLVPLHTGPRSLAGPSSVAERVVLAVRPFRTMGTPPEADGLAEALTEEILDELDGSYAGRLEVGRHAAGSVGDFFLEGTVQESEGRVRITARLVRASDRSHLWTGEYERESARSPGIQREVGVKIARGVVLSVLPTRNRQPARAAAVRSAHADAW